MFIQFFQDYRQYQGGQVVDVSKQQADIWIQEGVAKYWGEADSFVTNGPNYRAAQQGTAWEYLAGDLPSWTKGAEWSGGYPTSTTEIALYGVSMKFDGSQLSSDTGTLSKTGISPAVSFAGGRRIGILVYAHRLNPSTGIQLRIGTSASNYKSYTFATTENTLVEGWNFLVVHSQEDGAMRLLQTGSGGTGWVTGAGSYNFETQAATYMAIVATGMRAPHYPILWVSSLWADGGESAPMITLGFDVSSGYEPAVDILSKYGFKGYLAVGVVSQAGNGAMVSLYNRGWDILGHSARHGSMGTYTDSEEINSELAAVQRQLVALGMRRSANLFASPNGSWSNRTVHALAESGYRWCRNVTNAPLAHYDKSMAHVNPLTQGGFTCGAATAPELRARAELLLVKYKANCHFYTHEVVQGGNGSTWPADTSQIYSVTLDDFCGYLKARQDAGLCRVVTPSEYIDAASGGVLLDPRTSFRVPSEAALVIGASPVTVVNRANVPVRYVVSGGTVSAMDTTRDGATFLPTGQVAGSVHVMPGDSLRITHAGAPSVVQVKNQ